MSDQLSEKQPEKKPGIGSVVMSTLAAAMGVQSSKNRERDFGKGNFKMYVVSGIIFTVLFIITVATVARFAIKQAGG